MQPDILPELKQKMRGVTCAAGVLVGLSMSSAGFAVTAPYSEDFDSYPTDSMPDNFVVQTTGGGAFYSSTWTVQNPIGDAGVYQNNAAGDTISTAAAVEVTNLAQSNFFISTTFVVNSYGSFSDLFTDIHVGLEALASSTRLLSTGYQLSYELLDRGYGFPPTGALGIYRQSPSGGSTSELTLPVVTGITYTMTLTGTYSPGGLFLTGTLSDGDNSISVNYNDTTPLSGGFFGYFDFASGLFDHGAYFHVDYDDFEVSAGDGPVDLVGAASVLSHGAAGTFAIDMPLTGPSGVEDRHADTYNAVFTFNQAVTSGQVTVLDGTAIVGAITFAGTSMTAQLTHVPAAGIVTLHLQDINGAEQTHGDVPFGFLLGDVDANRVVERSDRMLAERQIGYPATNINFREDVNADGMIKPRDVKLVERNRDRSIP